MNAGDGDGMTPLHHAVVEGHGDATVALLVAGAESGKKDGEGQVAMELCPDDKVGRFIRESCEREGIELVSSSKP